MLSAIANPQPATVAEPGWQYVFISLAVVIILLEIIHGWRLGLVRQLVRVIAISWRIRALFLAPAPPFQLCDRSLSCPTRFWRSLGRDSGRYPLRRH